MFCCCLRAAIKKGTITCIARIWFASGIESPVSPCRDCTLLPNEIGETLMFTKGRGVQDGQVGVHENDGMELAYAILAMAVPKAVPN